MVLNHCDVQEFIKRVHGKEVACWGAGFWLTYLSNVYDYGVEDYYSYIVDSNPELWGSKKTVGCKELEICSPQHLFDTVSAKTVLCFSLEQFFPLYEELKANSKFENTQCYATKIIAAYESDRVSYLLAPPAQSEWRMNNSLQIPKVIHYIWFGEKPLPDEYKKYMESWSKFCPDYEIKQWNESNYDITAHPFMRETTAANRPGFTADYARLDIIYKYGGIYLDVDVELLKNLDELLYCSAYCGFEAHTNIALGLGFGAKKGHLMIKAFRDAYDSLSFSSMRKLKGITKFTPSPKYQTVEMLKYGLELNGHFQIINETAVYPAVYFNPYSLGTNRYFTNKDTYSIHHFAASWLTDEERSKIFFIRNLNIQAQDNPNRGENIE